MEIPSLIPMHAGPPAWTGKDFAGEPRDEAKVIPLREVPLHSSHKHIMQKRARTCTHSTCFLPGQSLYVQPVQHVHLPVVQLVGLLILNVHLKDHMIVT